MSKEDQKVAELAAAVAQGEDPNRATSGPGPPPLRSFGLVLHHDGSWSHEGIGFRNRRLADKFDRSVRYLPDEGRVYVIQIGRFRGLIDVEEAGFFVWELDLATGSARLSDGSREDLDVSALVTSERDGALLCRVKRNLAPEGLLARFVHSAQADFMNAVDESGENIVMAGKLVPLPDLGC
jgi:hypothetical protein